MSKKKILNLKEIDGISKEMWLNASAYREEHEEYEPMTPPQKWLWRHQAIAAANFLGFEIDQEVLMAAKSMRKKYPQMNTRKWKEKEHEHNCVECANPHEQCRCFLCGEFFDNPGKPYRKMIRE